MEAASQPPRRRDSVATKARILAAAKQCFSQVGYAGTGIRDIAVLAGVSYTMLGRYYGSKAGLLEATLIDSTRTGPVFMHPIGIDHPSARWLARSLQDVVDNGDGWQERAGASATLDLFQPGAAPCPPA